MDRTEILRSLTQLDTSCLCDVNKGIRAMDCGIRPIQSEIKLIGSAFTVSCYNDFLTVIKALQEAQPGDVLVIDGQAGHRALAGELFASEARRKGLAGLVVDGAVRDIATIRGMDLPVFSRSIYPVSGTTSTIFEVQIQITCGGIEVNPRDLVFGDADGIIVASEQELAALIPEALEIKARETDALKALAGGASLLDLLNFEEHYQNVSSDRPSRLKFLDT